ncbi:MAG: DUF342 domain-containing protein [Pontiellaceae bacterium]|nr:DUF342 domain-containing protein [Pontiellaceae bacterium]
MDRDKYLLEEWSEGGYKFYLHLAVGDTKCFLTMAPDDEPTGISPERLAEVLKQHKIVVEPNAIALASVCESVGQGKSVKDVLIAEGWPAKPMVPEHIDFKVRVSSMVPSYGETDRGEIDYHNANLFENVSAGQIIGLHIPEKAGEAGLTVLGNPIPVPSAAASASAPKTGEGVELDSDGQYIALLDGRVVFEGNTVSVTNELIIEKDVDYEVGDIDFVGFVHVRHSILPGFKVRAKLGLVVDHIVENTHIESDGDIRIGGMAGDRTLGTIRCGGNLTARYLREVRVECSGNITVSGEVMNCQLRSNGAITAALIAGGTAYAQGGIEANRLGSDAGSRTFVCSGVDFHHIARLDEIKIQIATLVQQRRVLIEKESKDSDHTEELERRKTEINNEIELLENERKSINQLQLDGKNAKVNVRKALFEGVVIRLGSTEQAYREYRSGSCSIIEHDHSSLVFIAYSPLDVAAEKLEKELLLREAQGQKR